jgi:hypothetical protein
VDVTIEVTAIPEEHLLEGTFAEPSEADPYTTFQHTAHVLRVRWSSDTQVIMGKPEHFQPGALLRAIGTQQQRDAVDAKEIVVKSKAASVQQEQQPDSE